MKKITKEDIRQLEIAVNEMTKIMKEGKQLRKSSRDATPDLKKWPALDNNNNPYHAYRFGVALAGSPDNIMPKEGPVGGNFMSISYSDGDEKILNAAAKSMGINSSSIGSSKNSKELKDVHKLSPVANKKRNKYGI